MSKSKTPAKPPAKKTRRSIRAYDPQATIVRPAHLPEAVGLSYVTAWRLRQRGLFPAPILLTSRTLGWRRSDLEIWLQSRGRVAE